MTAASWRTIPAGGHDIRLVVCDMDGTLLTESGDIPESFWPLLKKMQTNGTMFVPASGRQYATLVSQFADVHDGLSYIAENGNLVVHDNRVISTNSVDEATVQQVIGLTRSAAATADIGLVVCGVNSAYTERTDQDFLAEVKTYYAKLTVVADLTEISDTVLKLAIYDFSGAERPASTTFSHLADSHQIVVSGQHWIDIMTIGVDKGQGVRRLQEALGVTPTQTAVFGDYLNDLQMLDTADWSFAMANAHPIIRDHARYLAPPNREHGVVTVLSHVLNSPPGATT